MQPPIAASREQDLKGGVRQTSPAPKFSSEPGDNQTYTLGLAFNVIAKTDRSQGSSKPSYCTCPNEMKSMGDGCCRSQY